MTGIWVYMDHGWEPYILEVENEEHAAEWAEHMTTSHIYFFAELTTL